MRKLIFATNNSHKIFEIEKLLPSQFEISGLQDIGIQEEIPEDFFTLEENAFQKAEFIHSKLGVSCFADDTGLEIYSLNGEPGVFSARYSRMGDPIYPDMDIVEGNIRKVLEKLHDKKDRRARFRTVIALIMDSKKYSFEGIVEGWITWDVKGKSGFGYDPIFVPEGSELTFAEMDIELKNSLSHRARAVKKLVDFLKSASEDEV